MLLAAEANLFPGEARGLQRNSARRCGTFADGGRGPDKGGGGQRGAVQADAELVALANQLLDTLSQTGSAVLDLRPECIAPEGILAHSSLQGGQPTIEAGARASKDGCHSNETDSRLGVQDMQDDAGRAPRGQVPIVLFGQDTRKPGKSTTSLTLEGTLRLCTLLVGQHTGRDSLGLVVDQEKRDEKSVDDVAMEAERLLISRAARVAVGRAEAGPFHPTILAA